MCRFIAHDDAAVMPNEATKSEEEEVGTPEGTLTASTSAAQLQELKGTKCHVLDLHGCSQVLTKHNSAGHQHCRNYHEHCLEMLPYLF